MRVQRVANQSAYSVQTGCFRGIGAMTDEAFGGSDPARPGGRPNTARALLPLSGIVMAACAGIAAWLVLTPQAVREPDRTLSLIHI